MRTIKYILIVLSFGIQFGLKASNYYVSTNGDDSNNGSQNSPWKTLSKAISVVQSKQGHIIHLSAGTFVEADKITVQDGISIIGAGAGATTVKFSKFFSLTDAVANANPHVNTFPEQFVIELTGNNHTIRGFFLDGQSKKCHGGILNRDGANDVFDDLRIESFRYCGLWLIKSNQSEVKNCYLKNNTYGNPKASGDGGGDSGSLQFHSGTNLRIHDCEFLEEGNLRPDAGGYAMKGQNTTYGNGDPLYDMKIYNNKIVVPTIGAWENGLAPAISIEFLTVTLSNLDIHHNYINNHVSIPSNTVNNKCGRVHNNHFDLGIGRYAYAIEVSTNGLEIDHNYFSGGIYPLAEWGGQDFDHVIHHNVFHQQWANREIIQYSTSPSGFKFYNNTIYDVDGSGRVFASPNGFNDADVRNNLFVSVKGANRDMMGSNTSNNSNNGFYNIVARGGANTIGNPNLTASGGRPSPYFQLQNSSIAIDKGVVIAGITDGFIGSAPDLGAFESGQTPWVIGIQNNVNVPVSGISVSPASGSVFVGSDVLLIANVSPANATNITVTWSSSNTNVATVNASGQVFGKTIGTATITATTQDGAKSATALVTVSEMVGLKIEAENYSEMNNIINKGTVVGGCDDTDWLLYRKIDFKNGYSKLTTNLAVDKSFEGQIVEFRLDSPTGLVLGTLNPLFSGGWDIFKQQTISISPSVTCVHDVYVLFKAVAPNTGGIGDFDWFFLSESNLGSSSCVITSVEDYSNASIFNIYPNPTKSVFTVSLPNQTFELQIFNASGSEVLKQTVNGQWTNENVLLAGMYSVKITTLNGSSQARKLVIQ